MADDERFLPVYQIVYAHDLCFGAQRGGDVSDVMYARAALPHLACVFHAVEVLLGMAGDLRWGSGGDEVLSDVLPITSPIHVQPHEEQPVQ